MAFRSGGWRAEVGGSAALVKEDHAGCQAAAYPLCLETMANQQVEEVQQQLTQLREAMTQAQQVLGSAVEQLAALDARVQALAIAPPPTSQDSLEQVQTLEQKQLETLQEVRERGMGTGLHKTIDAATQLGHEQKQLVHKAMTQDGPVTMRDTLTEFRKLQQLQQKLLQDELGKFEAQGMRELLDSLLAMGEQQEILVQQLLERKRAALAGR